MLFVDLVGSTRLSLALPLKVYSDLMADVLQIMMLTCEARGGEVLPHQGDAVVSLWDARLGAFALEAASELHGRIGTITKAEELGLDLRVRVGVACGEAVIGSVRGDLTAFGPPMSVARRLCDGAATSQTLVCGATCDEVPEAHFEPQGERTFQDFPLLRVSSLHASPSLTRMKSS